MNKIPEEYTSSPLRLKNIRIKFLEEELERCRKEIALLRECNGHLMNQIQFYQRRYPDCHLSKSPNSLP